jgi:hypothetical protein
MKTYGGVDVKIHVFLTSALVRGEWLVTPLYHFIPGERNPHYSFDRRRGGSQEPVWTTTWKGKKSYPQSLYRLSNFTYNIFIFSSYFALTQCVSVTKSKKVMLFRDIGVVHSLDHKRHTNVLSGENEKHCFCFHPCV